jgi:hypothetical protein
MMAGGAGHVLVAGEDRIPEQEPAELDERIGLRLRSCRLPNVRPFSAHRRGDKRDRKDDDRRGQYDA